MQKLTRASLSLGCAVLLGSTASTAAEDGFDKHSFAFEAGYFLSSWNTELRVNGDEVDNGGIDLEESLGFDEDEDTYLLGFEWRFARRHKLSLDYWDFSRSARTTLEREVGVGNVNFPVGIKVSSDWDVSIVPISYTYAFYDSDSLQIFGSVGVHWTTLDFGVDSNTTIGSGSSSTSRDASAKTDAPLPLLGGGVRYRPWDRWELGLTGGWFGLDLDLSGGDLEGNISNADAYLEFSVTDNVRAGLKYTYFELDVDADADRWDGGADYEYHGPQIYLGLRF